MIQNRFLFFLTYGAFLNALNSGNIGSESIAFIKDRGVIWTHSSLFGENNTNLTDYATKAYVEDSIEDAIGAIDVQLEKAKGYFSSIESLNTLVPNPIVGEWAIVDGGEEWYIATCLKDGVWTLTDKTYEQPEINLNEYAKKTDLDEYVEKDDLDEYAKKTDIPNIPVVDDTHNGLMGSSMYQTLVQLRDTTIPEIQEDVAALQNLISQDNPNITEIIQRFQAIQDFIESLPDLDDQDALNTIIQTIDNLLTALEQETARAETAERDLLDRINNSAGGGSGDGTAHIFMTLSEYNALSTYEQDAIYFLLEDDVLEWQFGDVFPLTFN